MFKQFLSAAIIALVLFSCNESKSLNKRIDHGTMVNLLYDLSFTDGIVSTYSDFEKRTYVKQGFYDTVFTKYKVNREQFRWNILYYTETHELPAMYEEAINRLNALRTNLEKEKMDSLMPKANKPNK